VIWQLKVCYLFLTVHNIGNPTSKLTMRTVYSEQNENSNTMGMIPTVLVKSIARRWRISYNCFLTVTKDVRCKDLFSLLFGKFNSM